MTEKDKCSSSRNNTKQSQQFLDLHWTKCYIFTVTETEREEFSSHQFLQHWRWNIHHCARTDTGCVWTSADCSAVLSEASPGCFSCRSGWRFGGVKWVEEAEGAWATLELRGGTKWRLQLCIFYCGEKLSAIFSSSSTGVRWRETCQTASRESMIHSTSH